MQNSTLKKIYIEGVGMFAYSVINSIDHNMTTVLLATNTCKSVTEAIRVCKEYTLCQTNCDESADQPVDLRCFEAFPTRLRGLLSTDPENKPWRLARLPLVESQDQAMSDADNAIDETLEVNLD